MRFTNEQQKGITLIALVITIIILLILAGIVISQLTNSNIFNRAQVAVDQYNTKAGQAETVIGQLESLLEQYAGGNSGGGNTPTPTPTPARPLLSSLVSVGDYITYNPTLGVTNQSSLNYTSPIGELKVEGDIDGYIYYVVEEDITIDPTTEEITDNCNYGAAYELINANGEFVTTGYTVETDSSGNGYGPQSFTATASNSLWRVLDVTDGVVKIVPETPILSTNEEAFYLKGIRGYKNAKTELDNISEIFGHGQGANGAKSITIEQVNALTGYSPTLPNSTTVVGVPEEIGSWYDTDYGYNKDNSLADNIKSMVFKDYYWLASRCVYAEPYNGYFGVRFVSNNRVSSSRLYYIDSYGDEDNEEWKHGVLPVVSLRADVVKLGGSGSDESPWTFQVTE